MKKFLFLLGFLSISVFGQNTVEVDLKTPNATVYTHLYFLQSDSYQPEKAAATIQGYEGEEAIQKAIRLKQILDGKGLFVDFNKVPTNANYNDTIGFGKTDKYVLFPNRMPLISVEKVGEVWLYSTETMRNLDAMYNDVFPWYVQKIQKIIPEAGHTKISGIETWQIIGVVILLAISFLLFYLVKKITFFILTIMLLFLITY